MMYKMIPNSDVRVSAICLGSMNWGQQNTENEAHEQLDYAISKGVNFIDTAEIYPVPPEHKKQGLTEEYIGSWLKRHGRRDTLVLASKVAPSSIMRTRAPSADGQSHLDRTSIREAINGTLLRLGTDYLDLYQIHWPEREANFFGARGYAHNPEDVSTSIEETLDALTELIREGKTRLIGISNETPWGVSEYLRASREKGLAHISTIQNQYSLINRTFEIGLGEFAAREKIGLLAYAPLSMGVLTGKYLDGALPPGARFSLFARNRDRYNPVAAQAAVLRYVQIAKKHDLDPATMAIAFVLSRPFVTSTIVGATSSLHLRANIAATDLVLSPEVLAEIDDVHSMYPDPLA